MSVNVWELKDGVNQNDKNIVIFSLRSFGRSDLNGLLAGSKRSRQRNQNKTNMTFDIGLSRSGAKVNKTNQKSRPNAGRGKVANAAKAGKPAKAKRAVNPQQASQASKDQLVRPKGLPRNKWNSASLETKKRYVAEGPLVSVQGKRNAGRRDVNNNNRMGVEKKIPSSQRPPQRPQVETDTYGPVDFDWGEHFTHL